MSSLDMTIKHGDLSPTDTAITLRRLADLIDELEGIGMRVSVRGALYVDARMESEPAPEGAEAEP